MVYFTLGYGIYTCPWYLAKNRPLVKSKEIEDIADIVHKDPLFGILMNLTQEEEIAYLNE
jgi:hypothetical protein